MDKLLNILEEDATLTAAQLATMLGKEEGDIKKMISAYEKDGVILGYKTIIDWDKTDREYVTALIEVKLMPQKDRGFDKIAEKIYNAQAAQNGAGADAGAQGAQGADGNYYDAGFEDKTNG